ncbi:hypothetical protein [Nitrincola sp.]|uniref:hypothetical protein n=1 Tax=Nitrincola sp. TaxID=1926584 RepID=UPI003A911DC9
MDHLVLIGSPISDNFLSIVKGMTNIKNVFVIDLDEFGDPVYAGMTTPRLILSTYTLSEQMKTSSGYFYYAEKGPAGDERRESLAEELYRLGLR